MNLRKISSFAVAAIAFAFAFVPANSTYASTTTASTTPHTSSTASTTADLFVTADNNGTGLRDNTWTIAGDDVSVTRIKLQAIGDNVLIEDLSVAILLPRRTSIADFLATVPAFVLYSDAALTQPIGVEPLLGTQIVTFENINYVVANGYTEYLYLVAETNTFGTDVNDTTATGVEFLVRAELDGTQVEEESTGNSIIPTVDESTPLERRGIVATRIVVDSNFQSGTLVGGVQTLFSFEVTADAGMNETQQGDSIDTFLGALHMELVTDVGTANSENISNLQICRVDNAVCLPLNTIGTLSDTNIVVGLQTQTDGRIAMMRKPRSGFNVIHSGQTVQYVVRGLVSNTVNHFLQISIVDLDQSGLMWGYDIDANDRFGQDIRHTDLRADAPRSSTYPTLVAGSLVN